MQRALAFDHSPPLWVAFRFFLNVPLFLVLAALVLAWLAINDGAYTRWNPGVLAITHLLTLGVLASAMLGAMMQILPVATHIRVLHPRITSMLVHACLSIGTLALALGFTTGNRSLYATAVLLLSAAFLIFLVAVAGGLVRDWKRRSAGSREILVAVRFALIALAITLTLGLFMAGMRGSLWSPGGPGPRQWLHGLPDIHAVWGLAGWVGLLIIGVSYQVIPIFQATEIYPRPMTESLASIVFLLLLAVTAVAAGALTPIPHSFAQALPRVLLALGYLMYGAVTFKLLWTRKRPHPEPTTLFWLLGMTALILAAVVAVLYPWLSVPSGHPAAHGTLQMVLGTLLIPGVAVSAVNGMLYKIVPFLLWHNAQRRAPVAVPFMPKVREFISERDATRQFGAHSCAIALLLGACFAPVLLLPAALVLALSAALLAWNIVTALRLYWDTCRRLARA